MTRDIDINFYSSAIMSCVCQEALGYYFLASVTSSAKASHGCSGIVLLHRESFVVEL